MSLSGTAAPSRAKRIHLAVVHHGLWGAPVHLSYLATTLARHHNGQLSPQSEPTVSDDSEPVDIQSGSVQSADGGGGVQLVVLNSKCNSDSLTYDGIDWCGERLVKEIHKEVLRLEADLDATVTRFSIIGYSLGGLIARYAVGLLHSQGFFAPSASSSSPDGPSASASATASPTGSAQRNGEGTPRRLDFRSRPVPVSFTTLATPHLGMVPHPDGGKMGEFVARIGSTSLGRTGLQIYVKDSGWANDELHDRTSLLASDGSEPGQRADAAGTALLEAMSDPSSVFIRALSRFERIDIYANAIMDRTVPYRTAAIEEHDPFVVPDGLVLTRDPQHAPLLASYARSPSEPQRASFLHRASRSFSQSIWAFLLNPQRYPLAFPLNYLALLALPVLLPGLVGLLIHKLRSQSKESDSRVEQIERAWAVENGLLSADDERTGESVGQAEREAVTAAQRAEHHRSRVRSILGELEDELGEAARELGEDRVVSSPPAHDTGEPPQPDPAPSQPVGATGTRRASTWFHLLRNESRLSERQTRMARRLNDRTVLPQLRKFLAHFEGLENTHAVIIVRTERLEAHRRGIEVVRSFVERFEV